jgi:hypothetical protein
MKTIQWLTLGFLITVCTSCGMFSYLESHPQEVKDAEAVAVDGVHLAEDIVQQK